MTSSVHYSSASAEWATPMEFFQELHRQHHFTLDVCASMKNAKCTRYFAKQDDGYCIAIDGLAQSWANERCWCNPEYGRGDNGPRPWIEKALEERYNNCLTVFLVAARTDTYWYKRLIEPNVDRKDDIDFVEGRLKFLDVDGQPKHPAPFPSMVVIVRPRRKQVTVNVGSPFSARVR